MIGAISNLDALKRWFLDNGKPFFTLRYDSGSGNGNQDKMIYKNVVIEDMQQAWERLQSHVADQAEAGRAKLALIVYDKGKENNPIYTAIDIRPGYQSGQQSMQPAISGLPPGIGSINELVEQKVTLALLQKENADLKEQLSAPVNNWERSLETISGIPGMADVLKIAVAGLVAKFAPQSMPVVQGILNGTPDAVGEGAADSDLSDTDPQTRFASNIQDVSNMLQVDPLFISEKLKILVRTNPDLAKQLLQQ